MAKKGKGQKPIKKIKPLETISQPECRGVGLKKFQFNVNKDLETNKKIEPKKIFENYKVKK